MITGHQARIDCARLGHGLTFVIGVTSERSADQRDVAQAVLTVPEVEPEAPDDHHSEEQ